MEKVFESFLNLWTRGFLGKFLFLVLLPLALIAFGFKLYIQYQTNKANESLKKTKKDNKKLEEEKNKAREGAKKTLEKANLLAKKREKNKIDDIDDDWHLKE